MAGRHQYVYEVVVMRLFFNFILAMMFIGGLRLTIDGVIDDAIWFRLVGPVLMYVSIDLMIKVERC
jgi:hypothetical protein